MKTSTEGKYQPLVNPTKCESCGLCQKVCSTQSVNQKISKSGLGRFVHCYTGYSTDENMRWSGSSGGVITTLLCVMLNKGLISGAVILTSNPQDPLRPLMNFVNDETRIRAAVGSKYCPTKLNFRVKDLLSQEGKIAVVGLPCNIRAFREVEQINDNIKSKIFLHLGLLCGKCPNFYATEYFLKKAGINERDVASISYRGEGWPGKMTVKTKQGDSRTFSYRAWTHFAYYPQFVPIHCVLCYDITNQLADISLGDAWGLSHDKIGTSVIITRTAEGESILNDLCNNGKLVLCEIPPKKISKGQNLDNKVRTAVLRNYIWKVIFKQPIPISESAPEKPSVPAKTLFFNIGYCSLLYASKNHYVRILLCNLTINIQKLKRWKA